jgi:DNA polymerase III epsilon subunit-like protein
MTRFNSDALWSDLPIAVVDIETTGVDVRIDRIVEIGILTVRGGVVEDRWAQLVSPGVPIPLAAAQVHGVTPPMVEKSPSFGELVGEITRRLEGRLTVAHNGLRFDRPLLAAEMVRAGRSKLEQPMLDPMVWAHAQVPADHGAPQGLQALCRALNIGTSTGRGTLRDCDAVFDLTRSLAHLVPDRLGDLLDAQARWAMRIQQWLGERRKERG